MTGKLAVGVHAGDLGYRHYDQNRSAFAVNLFPGSIAAIVLKNANN